MSSGLPWECPSCGVSAGLLGQGELRRARPRRRGRRGRASARCRRRSTTARSAKNRSKTSSKISTVAAVLDQADGQGAPAGSPGRRACPGWAAARTASTASATPIRTPCSRRKPDEAVQGCPPCRCRHTGRLAGGASARPARRDRPAAGPCSRCRGRAVVAVVVAAGLVLLGRALRPPCRAGSSCPWSCWPWSWPCSWPCPWPWPCPCACVVRARPRSGRAAGAAPRWPVHGPART